jgi:hypothetical protein
VRELSSLLVKVRSDIGDVEGEVGRLEGERDRQRSAQRRLEDCEEGVIDGAGGGGGGRSE